MKYLTGRRTKYFWGLFCLINFLLCGKSTFSQEQIAHFDTIKLSRSIKSRFEYSISNAGISRIKFERSTFQKRKGDHLPTGKKVLGTFLTGLTGIQSGEDKGVTWQLDGSIFTDDPNLSWVVKIDCPGWISTLRERERQDDGSFTMHKTRETGIDWDKSNGTITSKADTICYFFVAFEPRNIPEINEWIKSVFKKEVVQVNGTFSGEIEFALWGDFDGRERQILFKKDENRIYLFNDNQLIGYYQPEKFIKTGRNKMLQQPMLLARKSLNEDEKNEWLLLSAVSQWFIFSNSDPK